MFLAHDEAEGAGQAGAAPGPVRPRAAAGRAHAVRVRQRLHRAAARLSRHRRLLGARLGQAAPGAHPHPGAGAQRAQRPLRARRRACRSRAQVGRHVTLWQPAHGGHVGFPRGRSPGPCAGHCRRPCSAGWRRTAEPPYAPRHGRDRQGRAAQVAQRAALLRLARAGRARRLVHARRPHPGRRPVPAGQGQPHRSTTSCSPSSTATTRPTTAGAWFFQNGPQRVYVELEAAPWVWRVRRRADGRPVTAHTGRAGAGAQRLARRAGPPVPGHRPRLRPRAHAGHGLRRAAVERGCLAAARRCRSPTCPARFGYVLRAAARDRAGSGAAAAKSRLAGGSSRRGGRGYFGARWPAPRPRPRAPWARRACRRPGWPCRPRRGRSRSR